jgi:hypothetical protein
MTKFEEILLSKKINPKKYLQAVQIKAMYYDYDWKSITFATDKTHKLQITRPDGKIIKFGAVNYNDFIIYGCLAKQKKMSYDEALKRRDLFRKRMTSKSDDNIYTARNLSILLLW